MRVAVIQMSPVADKERNIAQARSLIEGVMASEKIDLIVLPEIWTCLGGTRDQKIAAAEPLPLPGEEGRDAYEFLRRVAIENRCYVHGGSIGELHGERIFNTSLVFSPEGRELARYRKIHLFDITTPDGQGYRESALYGAGEQVVTVDVGGVMAGLAICYDLRFPELFLELRRKGAELIILPAAFTLQTGKDHWEVLLRARAIETQCWIAAAGCTGAYNEANGDVRFTYGHSLIADPWGHVVAKASDGLGWAVASIDRPLTARVRANMPVLEHRRLV
ncbi:carbon-nitrogen hydrolase family protein [Acidocella sp.]|uniref:carbon-nitrogen hydrolase family protein n=1 Tax=Acidocella sp. TaxID=50710 RepID=UPI003D08EC5D